MKTRLGPRAPKFVEYTVEKPSSPSRQDVSDTITKQINNWKFWKDFDGFHKRMEMESDEVSSPSGKHEVDKILDKKQNSSMYQNRDEEQQKYNKRHKMVKEFLSETQKKYSIVKPDIARIFGLPQFLLTALRRFDTSPIQLDEFVSKKEQKKGLSLFYNPNVVLPFHERDGHLLPDFFGAFANELDALERRNARGRDPALIIRNQMLLTRLQKEKQSPPEGDTLDQVEGSQEGSTDDSQQTSSARETYSFDPFFMDNQKRLSTFKASQPLKVRMILDRFGSGKFYEAMHHGTQSFTIFCGKENLTQQSLHKFTHDRSISSWMSTLRSMPNDAWRVVDIERSIATFILSRLVHLHYFYRKFKNVTPYDYLTSQYGLGSYSRRILHEICVNGLEMVPYETIMCMINEITQTIRQEGGTCSLVFSDSEEFSQIWKDRLISREGEKTSLLVKMVEVATEIDIDHLYILGANADLPRLARTIQYGNSDREMELVLDSNQPLIEDAKRMLLEYSNIEDCDILRGSMEANCPQHQNTTSEELPHTLFKKVTNADTSQDPSDNNEEFLFRLRNCRPWIPASIVQDLSMSGILAPLPNKNVFLKQSIHHTFHDLIHIIKSQIQLTVHRSAHQEQLKDKLLTLFIFLFLFPSTTEYPNDDTDLDWVSLGLFPPKVETYLSVRGEGKMVRIPQEPAAFEALKLTVQDMGFIEDINLKMVHVMQREFLSKGLINAHTAFLFLLLNNDVEQFFTVREQFAPLMLGNSSESDACGIITWMDRIIFSPEMIVDGEVSGITNQDYWQAVLAMALKPERQEFFPGDRDLPGHDQHISHKSKIYHSLLGAVPVNQLLYRISPFSESKDTYVWFTERDSKLYGCVIELCDIGRDTNREEAVQLVVQSEKALIESVSFNEKSSIQKLVDGVLFLKVNLQPNTTCENISQVPLTGAGMSREETGRLICHTVSQEALRSFIGSESLFQALTMNDDKAE